MGSQNKTKSKHIGTHLLIQQFLRFVFRVLIIATFAPQGPNEGLSLVLTISTIVSLNSLLNFVLIYIVTKPNPDTSIPPVKRFIIVKRSQYLNVFAGDSADAVLVA